MSPTVIFHVLGNRSFINHNLKPRSRQRAWATNIEFLRNSILHKYRPTKTEREETTHKGGCPFSSGIHKTDTDLSTDCYQILQWEAHILADLRFWRMKCWHMEISRLVTASYLGKPGNCFDKGSLMILKKDDKFLGKYWYPSFFRNRRGWRLRRGGELILPWAWILLSPP